MNRIPAIITILASVLTNEAIAEIPTPEDAPRPLSPEDSKKHFQLPEGFRIDLIASEPLVADPSCIAWDEHGRLFVTEIHGYNLEGHLDVTELNKAGKLDTTVRRIHVGAEMKAKARKGQHGCLKLLRDTNGDGRMDMAITWADDIPAAYGVVAALGGVIVTAEPHIYFFADHDDDGNPDERRILFSGFGRGEMERAINNPVWGPDNWIYAGQGWGGGTITGPNLKEPVKICRTDFRFKPDGSALEAVSGSNHTFGMSFDDFGNRWLITTSQPALYAAPLPHRYLIRNPHVASPGTTISASRYGNCFPTSQPHPWRRKRGADPRWVKFYGANEAKPNGNFTSGCGQQIYRANLFPEKYFGNHFCCDPQQSLIHRSLISRDGPGLRTQRPEEHAESEFLSSSDGWFRPNNLRVGPDGALYIVDMYREIIEDYSAIPRYLQQQYGLLNGDDRGRIWRLAPINSAPAPVVIGDIASVGQLRHPNAWWRETAQRLLIQQKNGEKELRALALDSKAPFQSRIAALYTLDSLDKQMEDELVKALTDESPALRLHALRIGEGDKLLSSMIQMVSQEEDPNVLLQLALSLGECEDSNAAHSLAKLATEKSHVRWMENAVLSSIASQPGEFLGQLATHFKDEEESRLIVGAAETAVVVGDKSATKTLLLLIANTPDPSLRLRLIELAAKGNFVAPDALGNAVAEAFAHAGDEDERLAALRLIRFADEKIRNIAITEVFATTRSPAFQEQAVGALLARPDHAIANRLVAELSRATPRVGASIVEALLGHSETAKILLNSKTVSPASFSQLQKHRLLQHDDLELRGVAKKLFTTSKSVIETADSVFHAALQTKPDLNRGANLFATHCAICHQFGGKGSAVGPPLEGEAGRPAESLLADILQPEAQITAGYATYLVKTNSGTSLAGILAQESATSVTISLANGTSTTVLRKDLASIERLELSLMPATFQQALKSAELADIIGFLKSRTPPAALVLFDDDPAFPAALSEGKGSAKLDWNDAASGKASVTIEGFQRHSRQIPGWNFPIREKPKEGEFRYLRLAMKSLSSKGIMVELAAGQRFPPETKPVRTYYVGENSTGWKSNELTRESPKEWRTFTIDLWKGNGEFQLTGIALTVMGGKASFDRIELMKKVE